MEHRYNAVMNKSQYQRARAHALAFSKAPYPPQVGGEVSIQGGGGGERKKKKKKKKRKKKKISTIYANVQWCLTLVLRILSRKLIKTQRLLTS